MAYERFHEAMELYQALTSSDRATEMDRLQERAVEEVRQVALAGDDFTLEAARAGELIRIATLARENQDRDEWVIQELVAPAIELFDALFDYCPRYQKGNRTPYEEQPPHEFIGFTPISVGPPYPPPSSDMLEQLKQLWLPDTDYRPDEDEHFEKLAVAIHIKGSILLTTWLFGYADDIQPTLRQLGSLLGRWNRVIGLDNSGPNDNIHQIYSLSKWISAELASLDDNYAKALAEIAGSISATKDEEGYLRFSIAPWLAGASAQAEAYFKHIDRLADDIDDWLEIVRACELLSEAFFDPSMSQSFDDFWSSGHASWRERAGWAEARRKPDRFRRFFREREDELAVQRLQTYFLTEELWESLPLNAREALVRADRALVSATEGGWAGIPSDLRIATGGILNECLWQPLLAWAEKQQSFLSPEFSAIRRAKELLGKDPLDLAAYAEIVLPDPETGLFLKNELHVPKRDDDFIRQRGPKFLKQLRLTRNDPQHGRSPDSAIVRNLYAEALGIDQPGILPSLLRLLATDGRSAP